MTLVLVFFAGAWFDAMCGAWIDAHLSKLHRTARKDRL
jgi:hypothetical protein